MKSPEGSPIHARTTAPDYPEEKCAVFGIFDPTGKDVAYDLTLGLTVQQDRGKGGSGIATERDGRIVVHRDEGPAAEVYKKVDLANEVGGSNGIGHNRYPTTSRRPAFYHLQPIVSEELAERFLYKPTVTIDPGEIVAAHNGNIADTTGLLNYLHENNLPNPGYNDSEMMRAVVSDLRKKGRSLEEAIQEASPLFQGAYSLLFMEKGKQVAFRDPKGVRPLVMGRDGDRVIFSSESSGIKAVRGVFDREVHPGEMVVVSQGGINSIQVTPEVPSQIDGFELGYFSGVASTYEVVTPKGPERRSIMKIRQALGRELAREEYDEQGGFPDADIVIAAPDTATPGALGFANESGIPFQLAFFKNNAIGRTFILPTQEEREMAVNAKLQEIEDMVAGLSIVLVEDTLVHGTTSRAGVAKLRRAGAKAVHLRVHTPPIIGPDFYGTDTANQNGLAAAMMNLEELADFIGVDSIRFLSEEGFHRATELPRGRISMSAFNLDYPIPIGIRERDVDKSVYERFVQNGRQYGYYRK